MSAWLAECIAPDGEAVAVDLDLSLVDVVLTNLELRKGDIVAGPVPPGDFDLVTARAVLHHVADVQKAVVNLTHGADPAWWTQTIAFTVVRACAPKISA
jgi:2-polyprenyl-3-methyl-5-hydroxy-6-metoxy-1,4-benzoquinol methylase